MKAFRILLVIVASLSFFACSKSSSSDERRSPTTTSIGQPCEVLLVLDKEVMASELKDTLKEILECDIPGLNQSEPFFRVSRVPMSIYKGEMLKMHSKLFVKIVHGQADAQLQVAYNVDAKPQIQALLTAPDIASLQTYIRLNAEKVRQVLLDHQLSMIQSTFKRHHSKKVRSALQKYGLDGLLPEEIAYVKQGKDCFWASSRTSEKQLNFVFYRVPAQEGILSDRDQLVHLRDSVLAENIPGSRPDQWVETVWEQEKPIVWLNKRAQNGQMITELRGLWQMRNGAMGGPFVSYAWLDKDGQLSVIEGFVFSPSTDKRDLVRRLEAGMRTIKPIE